MMDYRFLTKKAGSAVPRPNQSKSRFTMNYENILSPDIWAYIAALFIR